MNIYMDLEFTGLHKNADVISIGIVTDDDRTFYAEFNEFTIDSCLDMDKEWIQNNVINNLMYNDVKYKKTKGNIAELKNIYFKGSKDDIRKILTEFIYSLGDDVNIVGDCMSYDIVLFNDIFGHSFNVPSNISYIPTDICTMMRDRFIDPDIDRESIMSGINIDIEVGKHNALYDAYIIRMWYNELIGVSSHIKGIYFPNSIKGSSTEEVSFSILKTNGDINILGGDL